MRKTIRMPPRLALLCLTLLLYYDIVVELVGKFDYPHCAQRTKLRHTHTHTHTEAGRGERRDKHQTTNCVHYIKNMNSHTHTRTHTDTPIHASGVILTAKLNSVKSKFK